jgi:hypothetical protein
VRKLPPVREAKTGASDGSPSRMESSSRQMVAVVFMTQYLAWSPAPRFNVARELRAIVYGALQ